VAVVDRKAKSLERLPEGFSGRTVVGVGFDRDRLIAAGIQEATALAAVTNGDNSNILVARVAKETFGVERVVARIYDPRRAKIYERLGIPTIATVEWATERVLQRVMPDRPAVEWIDPSARVCLIERPIPPHWAGHRIDELDLGGHARIAAVTRLGESVVAGLGTILQEGDVVHACVSGESIERFDRHLATAPAKGGHR
jgi:trk system potassium uptake protein TrkA